MNSEKTSCRRPPWVVRRLWWYGMLAAYWVARRWSGIGWFCLMRAWYR